ncbi:hypothetical protein IID62_08075 [candidate division KSB1 bacterium]|nr:hypothetical protein [candidate division KSB1 bacterium]
MIDINLLGKQLKAKPVKKPRDGPLVPPKLLLILLGVSVVALFAFFYEDILNFILPDEEPPVLTTEESAPVTIDTSQTPSDTVTSVEIPVVVTPPAPDMPFDYALSMEHVSVFTSFVRSIPAGVKYNLISIRGNTIIAEIAAENDENMFEIQTSVTGSLNNYDFDAQPVNNLLQLWGTFKPGASRDEISPSSGLSTPESVLGALNTSSREHNITVQGPGDTNVTTRDNIQILPVRIKYSGSENNILEFLDDIREKRIPINITKISGENRNRGQSNAVTVLNFHFEIIM